MVWDLNWVFYKLPFNNVIWINMLEGSGKDSGGEDPFYKIQIEADLPTGVDWVKHFLSNKCPLSTVEQKQNVSASST